MIESSVEKLLSLVFIHSFSINHVHMYRYYGWLKVAGREDIVPIVKLLQTSKLNHDNAM